MSTPSYNDGNMSPDMMMTNEEEEVEASAGLAAHFAFKVATSILSADTCFSASAAIVVSFILALAASFFSNKMALSFC